MADRYTNVNELWKSTEVTAITRPEATRAARALYRKFGRKAGYPRQRHDTVLLDVRRCWITAKPRAGISKGWARLAHDVSHHIFRKRYPQFRPHHPLHSALEREIATFVIESGWLDGALKPKPRQKPSADDVAAKKLARINASIKRWDAKLRRAQNAIKKLNTQRKRALRNGQSGFHPRISPVSKSIP